jgi:hypothetical protein
METIEINLKMKKLHRTHYYAMGGDVTFSIYLAEEEGCMYWKAIVKRYNEEWDTVYRSAYPGIEVMFEYNAESRHKALQELNKYVDNCDEMQKVLRLMRKEELEQQLRDLLHEGVRGSQVEQELKLEIEEINAEL